MVASVAAEVSDGATRPASRARLKVALVDTVLNRHEGGMATALASLVDELKNHCDVTVFCAAADEEFRSAVHVIQLPALPVHRFLLLFFSFSASWGVTRRLMRVRERFDVVHCNSPLYGGWDVASVHFCSAAYLHSGSLSLRGAKTFRDRARRLYGRVMHGIAAKLESLAYHRSAPAWRTLLPVSEGLRRALETHFRVRDRIHVVPNGIDMSRYQPGHNWRLRKGVLERGQWGQDSFLCLFVGAGDWYRKGLDRVIGALQLLPERVKLIVVGRGDIAAFSRMASDLGVESRVQFVGYSTAVADYYRVANLFVFPSRYEAMPMVCLEAMACGVPLIATAFHGSESYLRDGVNGVLTEGDPCNIARAIESLLSDPGRLDQMSIAARDTAADFSQASAARKVFEEYEFVVRSKPSRSAL